jgi:hypothetical protein
MLLLKKITDWQEKNFPNATIDEPMLGMVEELGEHEDFTEDDIGDFMIFCIHYCVLAGCFGSKSFEQAFHAMLNHHPGAGAFEKKDLYRLVSRLCHLTLKRKQGIRNIKQSQIDIVVLQLVYMISAIAEETLINVIFNVFMDEVAHRDWVENPSCG